MLDTIFQPIYSSSDQLTSSIYFICSLVSLALGVIIAWASGFKSRQTKSFLLTLVLLPVIVQMVIMLVNDNVGAGVAVMGAFSLVRFRSAPGSAKEIVSIFQKDDLQRELRITVPEDLNYAHEFDDVFEKYTKNSKLMNVKTTNMGSLYKLSYRVELKSEEQVQQFIDELRCRNGNLEISVMIPALSDGTL